MQKIWTLLFALSIHIVDYYALEFNSIEEYLKTFEKKDIEDEVVDITTQNTPLKPAMPIFKTPPLLSMFPGSPPHPEFNLSAVGDPLILTPFIENGNSDQARNLSKVDSEFSGIESYTGFFTVNKKYNSNLFFWYVPAQNPTNQSAPLILWLQGGPGGSSLFGLFIEHGPYFVDKDLTLNERAISWSKKYNMLYIDQPAGTGFSFTDDPRGYATNQYDVARDLYQALSQFYKVFPERLGSDFYVTGESYAGKYVPSISYYIHKMNGKSGNTHIPLKGLAIGDGLSDPIHQMDYGDFLFQTGFVDENDRDTLQNMSQLTKNYIKTQSWEKAADMFDSMLELFGKKSGLTFVYNYLLQGQPDLFTYYPKFLNLPKVRKMIHVGNLKYEDVSMTVYGHLKKDIPKTVKPWIESLLETGYKVMIYNGQVDIIIAYPQTEEFIANLNWKGRQEYHQVDRKIWKVGGEVAGYAREVKNFRQVMVRNSGHILPYDQPEWGYDMIQRFIDDRSFSAENKIDLGRSGVTRQGYHYIGGRFCDGPDTDDSSKFMQYTLDAAIDQCNIDDTCGCIGKDSNDLFFLHKTNATRQYSSLECWIKQ